MAADLVKSLTLRFPVEVTRLITGYVATMVAEYAASPSTHWKSKDCAIFMVLALTVKVGGWGRTGEQQREQ